MGVASQPHHSAREGTRQPVVYALGGPVPWPMARVPTELLRALWQANLTPMQRALVDLVASHVYGPDRDMGEHGVSASYAGFARALGVPERNETQVRRSVQVLLERRILLRWPDPGVYNGFRYHLAEPSTWDHQDADERALVLLPRLSLVPGPPAEAEGWPVEDSAALARGSARPSVRTPRGAPFLASDQITSTSPNFGGEAAEKPKAATAGKDKARWRVEELYVRRGSGRRYTTTLLTDAIGDVLDEREARGADAWALVGATVEATDEALAVAVSEALAQVWDGWWKPAVVRLGLVAAGAARAARVALHAAGEAERVRARIEAALGRAERVRASALDAAAQGDREGLEQQAAELRGELLALDRGLDALRRDQAAELDVTEAALDGVEHLATALEVAAYTRSELRQQEIEAEISRGRDASAREAAEAALPELDQAAVDVGQTLDAIGVEPASFAVAHTRSGRSRRWETSEDRDRRETLELQIRAWKAWRWRLGAARAEVERVRSVARWVLANERGKSLQALPGEITELLARIGRLLAEPVPVVDGVWPRPGSDNDRPEVAELLDRVRQRSAGMTRLAPSSAEPSRQTDGIGLDSRLGGRDILGRRG